VLDAAFLPDGRILVALGEVGARLLTPDGRVVTHFDRPTHALVVSDHGDRAIGIAHRGEVSLLSTIDLAARTVRPWTEARLDQWARTYDGATWFVSAGARFQAIDTLSRELRSVWSVDTEHKCLWIARAEGDERVAIGLEGRPDEVWWYETASMTMRERRLIEPAGLWFPQLLTASGEGAVLVAGFPPESERAVLHLLTPPAPQDIRYAAWFHPQPITISRVWLAFLSQREDAILAELMSRHDVTGASGGAQLRGSIVLQGAEFAGFRLTRDVWTVFDNRGRVIVVSLDDGRALRTVRV
jgi:hypothetical protein